MDSIIHRNFNWESRFRDVEKFAITSSTSGVQGLSLQVVDRGVFFKNILRHGNKWASINNMLFRSLDDLSQELKQSSGTCSTMQRVESAKGKTHQILNYFIESTNLSVENFTKLRDKQQKILIVNDNTGAFETQFQSQDLNLIKEIFTCFKANTRAISKIDELLACQSYQNLQSEVQATSSHGTSRFINRPHARLGVHHRDENGNLIVSYPRSGSTSQSLTPRQIRNMSTPSPDNNAVSYRALPPSQNK